MAIACMFCLYHGSPCQQTSNTQPSVCMGCAAGCSARSLKSQLDALHYLTADAAKPLPDRLASCVTCCMSVTCWAAACAAAAGSYTFSRLMISLTTHAFRLLIGLQCATQLQDNIIGEVGLYCNTKGRTDASQPHIYLLISMRTVSPILQVFSSSCACSC